jgi:hypothetical protein
MDQFTEVTGSSWFSRIGNSIKGILVGIVLFVVSVGALFWNEGRAVKEAKRIDEGQAACVSVGSDKVDPANDGKLIHINADAKTAEIVTDPIFAVSAPAIRLKRSVEMYQWKESKHTETKKKFGGGEEKKTTYTYDKVWSEDEYDSSEFKLAADHRNPKSKPYQSTVTSAAVVNAGAFKLSPTLIEQMSKFTAIAIPSTYTPPSSLADKITVNSDELYRGANPSDPSVGDVRIRFYVINPGPVSVISQQAGSSFKPFVSAHGETDVLEAGTLTADQMFTEARHKNTMLTWLIRLVGFIVMWIGLMITAKPLSVFADVIPFLGNMVGFVTGLITLGIAVIVSFTVIAIAWIFYRPLLGIALLAVAVGVFVWMRKRLKARTSGTMGAMPVMPPPPPPIPS